MTLCKTLNSGPLIALFISVLMVVQPAHGQKHMIDGYIITAAGDTLPGLIRQRKWPQTPKKIEFTANGKQKTYWPEEIWGFGNTDFCFISRRVRVNVAPHNPPAMRDSHAEPRFADDTVFLEVLVKGEKSLFYYRDPAYKEHFYLSHDNGSNLTPLIYKEWNKVIPYYGTSKTILAINQEYKNQLKEAFKYCPELNARIAVIPYALAQLKELFEAYKLCDATDQVSR